MQGIQNISIEHAKEYINDIKSMDTDKNGVISYIGNYIYSEFVAANIPKKIYTREARLKEVF